MSNPWNTSDTRPHCLLHPIGMGSDTVEQEWPVKSCFQSADSKVDLYHGHIDAPALFEEQDAIDAGFNRKITFPYSVKYYKVVTRSDPYEYWRMERKCLVEQGTLPTGNGSGVRQKNIF